MNKLTEYWYNVLKEQGVNVESAPGPCFVMSLRKFTKEKGWFIEEKFVTVPTWCFMDEDFISCFLKDAKMVFLYNVEKKRQNGNDFLVFRMHPIYKNDRYCLKTKEKITNYYG